MRRLLVRTLSALTAGLLCAILISSPALAEIDDYTSGNETVFAHSDTLPWWLSAQSNTIFQWHPRFHADYSGPNSLDRLSDQAATEVATLYTGLEISPTLEAIADFEIGGGGGLSNSNGLAGVTNLDATRDLDGMPYVARLWYRWVIPLSDETVKVERGPLSILTTLPVRRLDLRIGKFAMVDFFDVNSVANDAHTQFMNWTVVNNGAYDYAADTRGYTYGAVIDYDDRFWGARFAEALISKHANGLNLQKNLQDAHSENYEVEVRPQLIPKRFTAVRFLAFTNFANMGDYHQAIDLFESGKTSTPDITDHRMQNTLKYGFGLNAEQEFTDTIRGFVRAGWNEGSHESFNYTEVNDTVAFGGDIRGTLWHRPQDKFGVAFVGNGLSQRHRQYLALGGLGFELGDGALSYGAEKIMECYYNFPLPIHPGFYGALDVQYIDNPGYNRARGPVVVPGVRIHVEM
ncbi:MAG TPA: carbohydrate porin [Patescibacteria group bacterium]|nr:carbohydrate porin [Patescibacteria group bacterium]